ncbi:MAG: hypothetical protein JWM58_4092 [Rhizobium sp.]|nr:hypothetical protein [Rhizobium sp.]
MNNFITKAAVAALVSFGALGAASQASAGGIDVDVRVNTPRVIVRKPVIVVKPAYVRPRVVVVPPSPVVIVKPAYGRCAPGLALDKAMRNGLNKVAISKVGPNRVVVSGKVRGAWAKMSFANVRGCPRV